MAFISWGWYPYRRERPQEGDTQQKGHARRRQEGGHLQAKESPRQKPTCQHIEVGLPASRTVRKLISVVETTQSVLCYDGSPNISYSGRVSILNRGIA